MKQNNDERIQQLNYGDFIDAKINDNFEEFNTTTAKNHPSYIKYQLFLQ
jgi:hypothetical protein